jgi:hypothetical protein
MSNEKNEPIEPPEHPREIDPEEGTEPDGSPVENPSG